MSQNIAFLSPRLNSKKRLPTTDRRAYKLYETSISRHEFGHLYQTAAALPIATT
ncbi:hypothetical protein APHCRT_1086 [Anaplasma phagocytophilum str. CRT53-1]|uniref:Uncharacterized protein n=1 Tax=Anaplasma phagocytophilum str. CRT53-1 TaxID=1359157 RepID=A0A0F3PVK9_ANAPH|nr:hypothetical protein APHCRT_1086 [Anaplasma phagocytophilum str. CRT53-1]